MVEIETASANFVDGADAQIRDCLNPANPRSFFLYAGAGSGKTRSLKRALDNFREDHGAAFRRSGRKIAVITCTNAADDEIAERVGEGALFSISTIHSFCWKHIGTFHRDIQAWLLASLPVDLAELREKQAAGRAGTKAALDRERAIASINRRLEWLSTPRRFTYNPNLPLERRLVGRAAQASCRGYRRWCRTDASPALRYMHTRKEKLGTGRLYGRPRCPHRFCAT